VARATGLRLILLGPPGAGKGTQATLLAARFSVPHISTGSILRAEVAGGSELGRKAKDFMDKGVLVPDDLILDLVKACLAETRCAQGFVLDGFPRSVAQAVGLEEICAPKRSDFKVVSLLVPEAELVRRLAGRRTCSNCGSMYHVVFDPPKVDGVCNRCGGKLFQRDDDREEIITARLEVYNKETAPLIDFYRKRRKLAEIEATGSADEVFGRVLVALEAKA
jgi:adenylate kinase